MCNMNARTFGKHLLVTCIKLLKYMKIYMEINLVEM